MYLSSTPNIVILSIFIQRERYARVTNLVEIRCNYIEFDL